MATSEENLRQISDIELEEILKAHVRWLVSGRIIGRRADLSHMDLMGKNLSDKDLRRANISKANLSGADLRGAKLSRADFSRANLSEAKLSGANLSEANLSGDNLSGDNLSGLTLSWADLSHTILSKADLRGANLFDADLSGANLSEARLYMANLSGANLSGLNLSGTDLSGANLSGADIFKANLSGTNLSGLNLSGTNLSRADLSDANLDGAILDAAKLIGADLEGAQMNNCSVDQADFQGAKMFFQQLAMARPTWLGQPLNDQNMSLSLDPNQAMIRPHTVLTIFPNYQQLAQALSEIDKCSEGVWEFNKIIKDGQTIYQVKTMGYKIDGLVALVEGLHKKLDEQSIVYMSNLNQILLENIRLTQINISAVRSLENHLDDRVRQLKEMLDDFSLNQLTPFELLLMDLKEQGQNISLSKEEIMALAQKFDAFLENLPAEEKEKPGFWSRLQGLAQNLSVGISEHAVGLSAIHFAEKNYPEYGLALVGGLGLISAISFIIKKCLQDSKKPPAGPGRSLPEP